MEAVILEAAMESLEDLSLGSDGLGRFARVVFVFDQRENFFFVGVTRDEDASVGCVFVERDDAVVSCGFILLFLFLFFLLF